MDYGPGIYSDKLDEVRYLLEQLVDSDTNWPYLTVGDMETVADIGDLASILLEQVRLETGYAPVENVYEQTSAETDLRRLAVDTREKQNTTAVAASPRE